MISKTLDDIVTAVNKVDSKKIQIIGHTNSSSGDANKNKVLSQRRANMY